MEARRYVGKWWLPGSPEQAVGGVLEVDSESSRLRLELTGQLVPDGRAAEPTQLIHGAADGRHITLIESMPANGGRTTIAQVVTTTQVVRPRVALVGVHLDDAEQSVFDGMQASLTGLTEWAANSGLDFEQWIGNQQNNDRARLTVRWTDPITVELQDSPERLSLHWNISSRGPKTNASERSYQATERVILKAESKSPLPWNGYLSRSRAVQDLLTIALQTASRPTEYKLLINRDGKIPLPYEVDVFFAGIRPSSADDDRRVDPLFTLDDLPFDAVIGDWIALRERIGLPLDVLLGLDYETGGYYQNRLFNAGSAAEGFHTALFPDSSGLPPEEHASVVRQVTRSLFYFAKKHKNWALSRIKDNRPGLKDRLVELVTKVDTEAVESLLTDVDTWAKWLKNARNAIGHLNTGELEKRVPIEDARYRLEYVTRALLHLVIVAELGLPAERQRQVVNDHWEYAAEKFGEAVKASQDQN